MFIDLLGFGMVLPLLPIYAKDFALQLGLERGHTQRRAADRPADVQLFGHAVSLRPLVGTAFRSHRPPAGVDGRPGRLGGVLLAVRHRHGLSKSLPLLFVSRIGAGIAGATISTAQAYIADATRLRKSRQGMALIGAAFGLGFTFGPLFGSLAVPSGERQSRPGARLCRRDPLGRGAAVGLFQTARKSSSPAMQPRPRHWLDWSSLAAALSRPAVGVLLLATFVCILSFANFESTLR